VTELKMRVIRERNNPTQEREPVTITRKSRRDLNSKLDLDRRLDQALKETFSASDSMAIFIC